MIDRKEALDVATAYFRGSLPDAAIEQIWATFIDGMWFVSFGKLNPPDMVESPGGWCVTVDAKTGHAQWFETL